MQIKIATKTIDHTWDTSIIPTMSDYIKIPNKSPSFDKDWQKHGYMDQAVRLLKKWCESQPIKGMTTEVIQIEGRTPLLFIEIKGDSDDKVLLYGHYDKQPEFTGWRDDLGPWKPVVEDGKLYGRGSADDGYALFSYLTAFRILQEQNIPHANCVIMLEGCEESGSYDLPFYMEKLKHKIDSPSLVVCLDAECGNYDQLWCTSSLRGNLVGVLSVDVLSEGVHSGSASGIVPSCFRIARELLNRIEDPKTGNILCSDLFTEISEKTMDQTKIASDILSDSIYKKFPWVSLEKDSYETPYELMLNNTWKPILSVTGADGLPNNEIAGNVLLPNLRLKLSFRLPPPLDTKAAGEKIKKILEHKPPPNCKIKFEPESAMSGWEAPPIEDWLEDSISEASHSFFNKPSVFMGAGVSIPLMGLLSEKFPKAQFLVTGLLGPNSNAHGPNEFMDIETAKKLTGCVAKIIADHHLNSK